MSWKGLWSWTFHTTTIHDHKYPSLIYIYFKQDWKQARKLYLDNCCQWFTAKMEWNAEETQMQDEEKHDSYIAEKVLSGYWCTMWPWGSNMRSK